jgi:predicted amino acid-binding ACT domain protein
MAWSAAMASDIRRIEYFRTTVKDEPGEGLTVLSALSSQGVNLVAFTAVPVAAHETQLMLYPESATALTRAATNSRMQMDGPYAALLVQGDDALGAIAGIHRVLAKAGLNVVSASGVTDGRGAFGYIIHLRESDVDRAANLLRKSTGAEAR